MFPLFVLFLSVYLLLLVGENGQVSASAGFPSPTNGTSTITTTISSDIAPTIFETITSSVDVPTTTQTEIISPVPGTGTDIITSTPASSSTSFSSYVIPTINSSATFLVTVPAGSTEVVILPTWEGDGVTETLTGATTLTATENVGPYGTAGDSIITEPPIKTFTFTLTVTSGDREYINFADLGNNTAMTLVGPTTLTQTVTAQYPNLGTFVGELPAETGTFTQTLVSGTQVLEIPDGIWYDEATIVGPTTFVTTFIAEEGNEPRAGAVANNSHCNPTSGASTNNPGGYVTYAKLATVLTAGQTLVTAIPVPAGTYTDPNMLGGETYVSSTQVFTGPTTVYTTNVLHLYESLEEDEIGPGDPGQAPGAVCGGACGQCMLYYPTVFVYYWPPANQNLACLGNNSATFQGNRSSSAPQRRRRGETGIQAPASTLVNSNGFTFTSPSVYIAFPTISAYDDCGQLGEVHTSTTLGFPPDQISTILFGNDDSSTFFSFNFADASCPPTTLLPDETYSIIGQTGYNPVISPLSAFTNIDPDWNANCVGALFQGNDPPFALGATVLPQPTPVGPVISAMPASPSPGVPALPVQTLTSQQLIPTTMPASDPSPLPQSSPAAQDPKPPASNPTPADPPSSPKPQDPNPPASNPAPADPPSSPKPQDPNPPASNPAPADPPSSPKPQHPNAPASIPAPADPPSSPKPQDPNAPASNPAPAAPQSSPAAQDPSDPNNNPAPVVPGPISVNSQSAVQVGPQTLTPGGAPVVFSGTTFSLDPSASSVVVNGVPAQVPAPAPSPASNPAPVITFGGQTITADPSTNFIIGSQTLAAGRPAITVQNTPISLAPSASFIVVGSSTQALAPAPAVSPAPAVLTFGGQTITADSSSHFVIGSQTLAPGGPAITVQNTAISLAPSASFVVVGSSTQALTPAAAVTPVPAVLSVGGSTITANSASAFVIGSQTLTPGGIITVSGTPVSLAPSASFALVGGSTQVLQTTPTPGPAILTLGGATITANSASAFVIGTQTLTPGGVINISGTPISLAPSASFAVIAGSTQLLPHAPTSGPAVLSFDGATITANSASAFVIGSQTLTPGGVITVSGTPVSLGASASYAVIAGSTQMLPHLATPAPAVLPFAGSSITANAASDFVIGTQTLTPGGVITVSGTPISLPVGGSYVVEGTSTIPLATAPPGPEAFTFAGQTYTANSASDFVIAGQTLVPGGVITVSGTPISLAATPTDVVIGTSTQGLGNFIISGIGGANPSGQPFLGTASHLRGETGLVVKLISIVGLGLYLVT